MVRLILVVIVSMSAMVPAQWKCKFEHGFEENWDEELTRAVGPTEYPNARGTLPQPAPSDSNSIWLAPNGNDGNAGTQAAPKLTVIGAEAAMTAGLSNLQIFRNGYVGEIIFSTASVTFDNSRTIQVEEGETATFELTSNSQMILGNSCTVNGLAVTGSRGNGAVLLGGTGCRISNVFASNEALDTLDVSYAVDFPMDAILEYSTFISGYAVIHKFNFAGMGTVTGANNCIIMINRNMPESEVQDAGNFIGGRFGIVIEDSSAATSRTLDFDRCIWANCQYVWTDAIDAPVRKTTASNYNFTSCTFPKSNWFGLTFDNSSTHNANVNVDYCQLNTVQTLAPSTGTTVSTGVVITETNAISPTVAAMYTNYGQGLAGDPEGFRLQMKGKTVPGGGGSRYVIDSPLVDAGSGGDDINPWDESVTLTSIAFTKTTIIDWKPTSFKQSYAFVNPTRIKDVRGDTHSDYDGKRRSWEFAYNTPLYTSMNDYKKFSLLAEEKTAVRIYPKVNSATEDPNLFIDPETNLPIAETGSLVVDPDDSLRATFTMNPIPAVDIENSRAGLFMILRDGSDEYHLMIESHSEGVYQLVDVIQFPSQIPANDDYDFTIEYMMVTINIETPAEFMQDPFSSFLYSGSAGDFQDDGIKDTSELPPNNWVVQMDERHTLGY